MWIMKTNKKFTTIALLLLLSVSVSAQQKTLVPDLSKVDNVSWWRAINREVNVEDNVVHLNAQTYSGVVYRRESGFSNGKIELDIRGENNPGKSFVGFAFHGLNDSIYDAIYFRPFNFKNPERNGHSVQYIAHPTYTWRKLRTDHPEKYENPLSPVPNPDDWFHVTIIVNYPEIKVFVDDSKTPSLVVKQISTRKEGWFGFWVGHGSKGSFKNLQITSSFRITKVIIKPEGSLLLTIHKLTLVLLRKVRQ